MLKKAFNVISITILTILTILSLVLVGPPLLGYKTYAVLSGSMEPELNVGGLVYIKPTPPEDILKGDIITYTMAGNTKTLVTHRVSNIDLENQEFITKGDANKVEDGPIAFNRLIGKKVFHLPYLGYMIVHLKTKEGILLIVGLALLMMILNFIPELLLNKDEKKKI